MSSTRVRDKTAIVTGGTQGIGAAVSRLLWTEGAQVILVARQHERGERLVAEFGDARAVFVAGDIAEEETAQAAVAQALEAFGKVDILVNNAATDFVSDLLKTEIHDVRRVLDINFVGSFIMLREAAVAMAKGGGGAIVNVLSRTANVGVPGMAIYGSAKGALLSLTRGSAVELAPHGIRVNAVAPGLTETPLVRAWLNGHDEPDELEQSLAAAIPQRRFGRPADVAAAILFLVSEESSHITGACIPVDGGYTAA